jgi:hypothetical protein
MQPRLVKKAVRYSSGWRTMSAHPWFEENSVCSSTNVRSKSEQFSKRFSGIRPSMSSFGRAMKVLLNCCNKLQSKKVDVELESIMIELLLLNFSGPKTKAPL